MFALYKICYLIQLCSTLHPFDIYGAGLKAAVDFETKMALEDKIHYFCEECDNLQVFQYLDVVLAF